MQQTASIHHLPGRVSGNGAELPIEFKYTGNMKGVRKSLGKDFTEELTGLLRTAGYAGTFSICATKYTKGTPHTKGLRIKSPSSHGIELTWHQGSNDNCLAMILSVPHQESVTHFHTQLRAAQTVVEEKERKKPVETGLAGIAAPVSSPTTKQEKPDTPQASVVAPISVASGGRFVDDLAQVELFVEEVAKHVNSQGIVSKRICLDVIRRFGITMGGVGKTFSSLVQRGHLLDCGGDTFGLNSTWALKFGAPIHAPQPTQVASPTTAPDSILNAYRALEEKVSGAAALRAKLARLKSRCAELKRQYDETAEEHKSTKAELDDLAESEQKLALIREALGIL